MTSQPLPTTDEQRALRWIAERLRWERFINATVAGFDAAGEVRQAA